MDIFLLVLALLGHGFLWVGLINRLHALGFRRWVIARVTAACFLFAAAIPVGIAWWFARNPDRWNPTFQGFWAGGAQTPVAAYTIACWIIAVVTAVRLLWFRCTFRTPSVVRLCRRRRATIDPAATALDARENTHSFLARLPYNEILRLDVVDWTLEVPRLPPALDGLSIVHLSDTHFTGRVGKAYFREVVRVCNELQPDLTALTGDVAETPECLDWIPDTLGQLEARYGAFFVLGNHDLRTGDVPRLRGLLEKCGLVDLGGRQRQIEITGCPVWLAGNERPWIDNAESPAWVKGDSPVFVDTKIGTVPFRITLSHSPDQFAWARALDADLLLAGHTHGGQIRVPPLGAVFSPSLWGVRHIAGIYYRPPTIMHLTRGVSSDIPIRWLCPPEVVRLRLQSSPKEGVFLGIPSR
jgi:uncharacterized protein